MRWVLHGTLTPAVADALRRHGHDAVASAALDPAPTDVDELLETARVRQLDVMTDDAALAQAPFEGGCRFHRTLVYLQLDGQDVEQDDAVDRLFERYRRLSPGRLYTVTATRVKVRQLPAAG